VLGGLEKLVVEGERKFFTELDSKRSENTSYFSFIPAWLSGIFDTLFQSLITALFHFMGLDYVSKYTKISVFCLLVLNPLLIAFGLFVYNLIMDLVDPPPQLIPA